MTARRDGCLEEAINTLQASIENDEYGNTSQAIAELRAAIAVLRAAGKAQVGQMFLDDPDSLCILDYEDDAAIARAILNARRVHEKGKK
jgi:hypothetical protein